MHTSDDTSPSTAEPGPCDQRADRCEHREPVCQEENTPNDPESDREGVVMEKEFNPVKPNASYLIRNNCDN